MQKLNQFVTHFDPKFSKGIRGATPRKIAELERLAGLRLPHSYREFLAVMGESRDWLQPTQASFDIDTLLQYYSSEAWRPPANYLKIGLGETDPFFDVYLEANGAAEPRVVAMPRGPTDNFEIYRKSFRHPLAGSLEEYLATAAYRTLRLDRLPNALRLAGNDPAQALLQRASVLLASLGLKPLWFSNDWVQVFASDNAAAVAIQFQNSVLAIDAAAADPDALELLRRTLTQNLALPHVFSVRKSGGA